MRDECGREAQRAAGEARLESIQPATDKNRAIQLLLQRRFSEVALTQRRQCDLAYAQISLWLLLSRRSDADSSDRACSLSALEPSSLHARSTLPCRLRHRLHLLSLR